MNKYLQLLLSFVFISLISTVVIPNHVNADTCLPSMPTTAAEYEQLLKQPIDGKWYRGDYGQSITLPNGKSLFVFGDTIMGSAAATWADSAIHNSAIIASNGCATALTGAIGNDGKPTDWVKVPATLDILNKDDYYWSSTPYMDGTTLRVFMLHEYNDASGFHPIGSDIATFSIASGTPVLQSVKATPSSQVYENAPIWGAAVFRGGNYTYIFGSWNKHEFLTFGNYYYLARVANTSNITNISNWRYWNGSSWTSNKTAVTPIISGVNGPGTNATVFKNGETYVLVSKVNDVFGTELNYWTAPAITGPWTVGSTPLISPIPNVGSGEQTYLGLAHPQQPLASGKLLVSWSLNSSDPAFLGNPRYGVYFSEITLP